MFHLYILMGVTSVGILMKYGWDRERHRQRIDRVTQVTAQLQSIRERMEQTGRPM
jgi:hypothetical protein